MDRLIVLCGLAVTCLVTAVLNVIIQRATGFNVFSFHVWFVIPVGAILVGLAAGYGGLLAARLFNVMPNWIDGLSMALCAMGTMLLTYYIDYSTFVYEGKQVSDYIGFWKYLDISLTESHLRIGRSAKDTGRMGEFGYALALFDLVGFLVGGFAAFATAKSMLKCNDCNVYVRKVTSTNSGDVSLDEADKLLNVFNNGSFEALQFIFSWQAPKRKFPKDEKRARLTYTLYECPKCKQQQVMHKASVYDGSKWKDVDALKSVRGIAKGLSLRDAFKAQKNTDINVFKADAA